MFSSVSFVSLYQTKAQRSGFCLELRSKGAERGMPSPAGHYTRSGLCDEVVGMGFCPIWGIWRGAGSPATSQMRCWRLPNGRIFPAVAGILCALNPRFSALPARRRNVGFSRCAAHTLAGWAENRTQRQHAAHGAVQASGAPTGSIGTIFFTVGRSAPSTLFRQMRRSPLLFRNDTEIPFFLRASTLFRI